MHHDEKPGEKTGFFYLCGYCLCYDDGKQFIDKELSYLVGAHRVLNRWWPFQGCGPGPLLWAW